MLNAINIRRPERSPAEQIRAVVATWRAQGLDAPEVRRRARELGAAIRSDMAHGADPAEGAAFLAELAEVAQ